MTDRNEGLGREAYEAHRGARPENPMTTAKPDISPGLVRSLIPARMDRLPWTRFHTKLVMSLGTAWILDGLEIMLASSVASVLTASNTLHLSSGAVGF